MPRRRVYRQTLEQALEAKREPVAPEPPPQAEESGELPTIAQEPPEGQEWDDELGLFVLVNDEPDDNLENQRLEVVLKDERTPRRTATKRSSTRPGGGKGSLLPKIKLLSKIKL